MARAVTLSVFFGRWIRNEWRWLRPNGRPLEVEAQASCYQRWWKEYARLKKDAQSRGAASYSPPDFEC